MGNSKIKNYIVKMSNNKKKNLSKTIFSSFIRIFLILYASLIAPKISERWYSLFNSMIFQFCILFLICYVGVNDVNVALLLALSLILTMIFLKKK